ncbi:hypothetical protein [Rhodopila sp.]|uniref:hypothetical protein n=1 Tax=Rhodopila sp. TaxID=2480087 RepID=UPI003D0F8820
MLVIKVDTDGLLRMEKALIALADKQLATATAKALTRVATGARKDVMGRLDKIFDRPVPFTLNAIRYEAATRDHLQARVFISDDAPKGISPRKYLEAEIAGGNRGMKRSEKALVAMGLMQPDQHIMPAKGMTLDGHGNISASAMTLLLSRIGGFREAGYSANATAKTKKRLARRKMATRRSGTDFFVAQSKQDSAPLGVYQLMGRHNVAPILYFSRKAPSYRPIFPFPKLVEEYAKRKFAIEMIKAVEEEMDRSK